MLPKFVSFSSNVYLRIGNFLVRIYISDNLARIIRPKNFFAFAKHQLVNLSKKAKILEEVSSGIEKQFGRIPLVMKKSPRSKFGSTVWFLIS